MIFTRRRQEEPHIDLTSLVDVVFLLLIFFMISTTFIEAPGLGIRLPKAGTQRPAHPVKEVKVFLDRQGKITYDGNAVTLDQLAPRLRKSRQDHPDARFVLLADEATEHGRVVQLMDLAQRNGFEKLAIATNPAPPPATK